MLKIYSIIVLILLLICGCESNQNKLASSNNYLGQIPPGDEPEIFAPGIISHGFHELGLAISPDFSEMFYITSDRDYSHYIILTVKNRNGEWTDPEVAPFTGSYSNYALTFSPGGNRLYFSSKRPLPGESESCKDYNIWFVEKENGTWSEAVYCSDLSSDEINDVNISFASDGSVYIQKSVLGESGDIYYSQFEDDKFMEAVKLDEPINTGYNESSPFISQDGQFLLFHSNRPGGLGWMDIYVSFIGADGTWGEPINMGEPINTEYSDFGPYISPDGKNLFFSSYRNLPAESFKGKSYKQLLELYNSPQNGYATLYWINADVIMKMTNNGGHDN